MRLQQLAVFWYLVLETNGMACLLAMRAFGAALLILGLVSVALSLPGILHVFAGGNRPPDNRSWAPAFVGVALIGMDPERRHRDVITNELRWSVTGTDRIADMDYSVHEALLDLLERGNSATSKRPHAP